MKNIISIIAIMLVVCMFAACTGPVDPNEETTAGNTTEATTVAPTETTEEPTTETTEAPVTETTEAPATETTEAPVTETTEAPATETTEAPATETTEAPVTETTEAPATETTEAPATETTEAPATETTEAPATETTEAPATETTEEATEEVTEERPSVENCTHSYEQAKAELLVAGGSCVEGVRVTYECNICGDSWGYTYYNTHIIGSQEVIDLGDYNVCDGHNAVISECLCGTQRSFEISDLTYSIEYEPENVECDELIVYDYCGNCGLSATVEKDLVEVNGCVCIYNAVITIDFGGETVAEVESAVRELAHRAEVVMLELSNGSVSCEDGVSVVYRCIDCGETWQEMKYEHTGADEKIDLSGCEEICDSHFIRVGDCVCGDLLCVESDAKQWSYTEVIENEEIAYYTASCPYCELTVNRYELDTDGAYRYEFFYGEEKIGEYSDNVSAQ